MISQAFWPFFGGGLKEDTMSSPAVEAWMANSIIRNRAGAGGLAVVMRDHISRGDIICNSDILIPIIQFHGLRPSVDALFADVEKLMRLAKPSGLPEVKRNSVKLMYTSSSSKALQRRPSKR